MLFDDAWAKPARLSQRNEYLASLCSMPSLVEWLESQPLDKVVGTLGDMETCLVATFLRSHFRTKFPTLDEAEMYIVVEGDYIQCSLSPLGDYDAGIRTPEELKDFILWLDEISDQEITAESALRLLHRFVSDRDSIKFSE